MSSGRVIAIVLVAFMVIGLAGLFAVSMQGNTYWLFGSDRSVDWSGDTFGDVLNNVFDEIGTFYGNMEDSGMFNFGGAMNWKNAFANGTEVDGRLVLDPSAIGAMKVSWIGGSLTVSTHGGSNVEIVQSCKNGEIPADRRLVYRIEHDGKLVLREGSGARVTSKDSTDLAILLPESGLTLAALEISGIATDVSVDAAALGIGGDATVSTVSGVISLAQLEVGADLCLSSTSGKMELSEVKVARDVKATSTSGGVTLSDVSVGGSLEVEMTSGNVKAERLTAGELDTDTVSGSVTVEDSSVGEVDCDSVSGKVVIKTHITPHSVDVDTTSGLVELCIIGDADGFVAEYDTVSGAFRCDFESVQNGKHEILHGDGAASFEFNTVSGDISITKG